MFLEILLKCMVFNTFMGILLLNIPLKIDGRILTFADSVNNIKLTYEKCICIGKSIVLL